MGSKNGEILTGSKSEATVQTNLEAEVLSRYAGGARQAEAELCCPINTYDPSLMKILPAEIVEKDYGCGNPSVWVGEGETVVDLGSGAGKICYILAQKVGPEGKVIGVDFNDAMLELARKYQGQIAQELGYANVQFFKGRIQDLALDLDQAGRWLADHPVATVEDLAAYEAQCERLRVERPAIGDSTVDVVVSNCVLNLVRPADKIRLFEEIYRVLRRGGRAVISDIVCDEDPTETMLADPKLWSGCLSGAFREDRFGEMFEAAGFHGIEILEREETPWRVIEGIEFRSMTIRAFKGKHGPCDERLQAAVYRGPWKKVVDDDGHTFVRGHRAAVCDKTYRLLTDPASPYAGQVIGIEPLEPVAPEEAQPFDCKAGALRPPRQTKGIDYRLTHEAGDATGDCCGPEGC